MEVFERSTWVSCVLWVAAKKWASAGEALRALGIELSVSVRKLVEAETWVRRWSMPLVEMWGGELNVRCLAVRRCLERVAGGI